MGKLKNGWYKVPKSIRKPLVCIAGFPLLLVGILLLILPGIPGSGCIAVLAGLTVLATEFAFADKARAWFLRFLKNLAIWFARWVFNVRKRTRKLLKLK